MESRSLFSVCKIVLDSIREKVELSEAEFLQQVDAAAEELKKFYYSQTSQIDYSNIFIQAAYVKVHFTIQAYLTDSCLRQASGLENLIYNTQDLKIAMIGCGPATEVVGYIKYLCPLYAHLRQLGFQRNPPKFALYDCVDSWHPVIQTFWDEVTPDNLIPGVNKSFNKLDLLSANNEFDWNSEFGDTNLVTFNYLFSELKNLTHDQNSSLENNVRNIINAVRNDCCIQIIDVGEKATVSRVKNLFCAVECSVINFRYKYRYQLPSDEDKQDLGPYFNFNGTFWPKLTTDCFTFVLKIRRET